MINLINEIAQSWWIWMGPMFWQASLLILILISIDALIRNWAWPQVRYALWTLVLIKLVIPPAFTLPVSIVPHLQPVVPSSVQTQWQGTFEYASRNAGDTETTISSPAVNEMQNPVQMDQNQSKIDTAGSVTHINLTWKAYLLMTWFTGMIAFIVILTSRIKRLMRWHREQKKKKNLSIPHWFHDLLVTTASNMNIHRLPAIVFSEQAVTPAVYGFFQPVLLFPAGYFKDLSPKEAEHVLLHELAHIKRGDLILHTITLVLHIVYWFNPLMILVGRQIKHIRELCCDLTVANILKEKTSAYRQTLVDTARELLTESLEPGMGLLGVWEEPFKLVSRLKWLEKKTWQKRKTALLTALLASLFLAVSIVPMGLANQNSTSGSNGPASLSYPAHADKKAQTKTNFSSSDISIHKTKPFTAVIIQKIGNSDVMFEDAVDELKTVLKKQKIKSKGYPFGRFWSQSDRVPVDERCWEVGFPVDSDVQVKAPLQIVHFPAYQVASTSIQGILHTEPLWYAFIDRIKDMGYIPAFPPAVEVWKSDSDEENFWYHTEMQLQVFHPEQGYPGFDIRLKEQEELTMLTLPMQGSYEKFPEALARLEIYVNKNHIKTTGLMMSRHFSDPSTEKPADFLWEVGCSVEPGSKANHPFKIKTIGGFQVASSVLNESPKRELPWAAFIIQNMIDGRIISGPLMEIWHAHPEDPISSIKSVEMVLPVSRFDKLSDSEDKSGTLFENIIKGSEKFGKKMQSIDDKYNQSTTSGTTQTITDTAAFLNETMMFTGDILKALAESFGADLPVPEISYKEVKPFYALILPMIGSYDQHIEAVEKLQKYMHTNKITKAGALFGRYFHAPGEVPEDSLAWEIGIPVKRGVDVEKPFLIKYIDDGKVAYSILRPGVEASQAIWTGFILHLMEKGIIPIGPPTEIWYNQYKSNSDEAPKTEMRIQVAYFPKNQE